MEGAAVIPQHPSERANERDVTIWLMCQRGDHSWWTNYLGVTQCRWCKVLQLPRPDPPVPETPA